MHTKKLPIRTVWVCIAAAIITLICGLFFFYSIRMHCNIREKETQAVRQNASNVKLLLDNTWDSLLNSSFSVAKSAIAKDLTNAADIDALRTRSAYRLFMDIRNMIAFNPMLDDVTIYYPSSGYIIGKLGVKRLHPYWALSYGADPQVSYDEWHRALYQSDESGYFSLGSGENLHLFYRLILGNQEQRILIVQINRQTLCEHLQWVCGSNENCFAAVTGTSGNVYASTNDSADFIDTSVFQILPENSRYLYTTLSANIPELSYLIAVQKSEAYQLSSSSIILSLLLLVAATLSSVLLASWLIQRNITPIEKLAAKFKSDNNLQRNELDIIDSAISSLLSEQDTLNALSRKQQIIISRSFMTELLRKKPQGQKTPEDIAATYGLSFENAFYCVLARTRAADNHVQDIFSMLFSYDNDSVPVYWAPFDNVDVFLLNYDADTSDAPQLWHRQLQSLPGDAHIAVSASVDTSFLIMDCWASCAKQLGCQELLPEEYTAGHKHSGTDPSNRILDQFQQCLSSRSFDAAQQLADALFIQYINNADPFYFSYRNYHLIDILLPYSPAQMETEFTRLTMLHSREQWTDCLCRILTCCMEGAQPQALLPEDDVAGKINSIITEQYDNPLLDIRMISSEIGLSQSYLSRLFKQKYGISVARYINCFRIERAKELLLSSKDSVKVISMKVGFAGDVQFIRAFKRLEDITPSAFRATHNR